MPSTLTPKVKLEIIKLIDSRIYEKHVTREDFTELKNIVKDIGTKVGELAHAQKRTEEEIRTLTKTVKNIHKELGGLSHTVGYHLEDRAIKTLPILLKRDFGIEVEERLVRRFFIYEEDKEDEVDIYGIGFKDDKEATIIGESKTQLSKDDIDDLLKIARRVTDYTERKGIENILIAVSYAIKPEVEEYAKSKGIKLYWSYELDL